MSLRELLGLNDYFGGIKRMKKTAIVSALCLSLLATGCTISQPSQESESSTTSSATTESEASSEATTEAPTETTTEASEEPTTFETFVFEKGDSLTTHNIFLSNFAEQGISLLDTRTCALTDVVRFAIYFSDINKRENLEYDGNYVYITVDKVQEVAGKYLNYTIKDEDIEAVKDIPAGDPIESDPNIRAPLCFKNNTFYMSFGAGEKHTGLAITDYAENLGDGTLNLLFTVYDLNIDKVTEFDTGATASGWNKYYAMTSAEASVDPDLTRRATGTALIGEGQERPYLIRYEIDKVEQSSSSHEVAVETVIEKKSDDGYTQIIPKLIVDGKEATEINEELKKYIHDNYQLDILDDGSGNGVATSLEWGVKDNVVSIVIHASETFTDGFSNDVFNYDVDSLKALGGSEVVKAFGMTDDDFLGKTKDAVTKYCNGDNNKGEYDLDRTLEAVNYTDCTPYALPDGSPAVAARIYLPSGSQFESFEMCFNLTTGERVG